jgi:preprotein translocase subunit SecB
MAFEKPFLQIRRKYIKTIEFEGPGEFELEKGRQVISSRIMHRIEESDNLPAYPEYKTILVLQCVEYEEPNHDAE